MITIIAGGGGSDSGPASNAALYYPQGLALDISGNLYIADTENHIIRIVKRSTGQITTIAGTRVDGFSGDGGEAIYAKLDGPFGLAADLSGNLYIADTNNFRIRFVNSEGFISTYAGGGIHLNDETSFGDDGAAADATFLIPVAVALDNDNNLYIADAGNNNVRKVNSANGIITTFAGDPTGSLGYDGDGSQANTAFLYYPTGVAVGPDGKVYIADSFNYVVRVVATDGIISTFAGVFSNADTGSYSGDGGLAASAHLNFHIHNTYGDMYLSLVGIAVDQENNVYISDTYNNVVRMVSSSSGFITTFAGDGQNTNDYNDGNPPDPGVSFGVGIVPTNALLTFPAGLAIDVYNNLYIATGIVMDFSHNSFNNGDPRAVIRMVGNVYTCPPGMYPSFTGCDSCPPGTIQENYIDSAYAIQSDVCQGQPTSQPSVQPSTPSVEPTLHHPSSQGTNWPMNMGYGSDTPMNMYSSPPYSSPSDSNSPVNMAYGSNSPYSSPSDNSPMSMSAWQPIQQVCLLFVVLLLFR